MWTKIQNEITPAWKPKNAGDEVEGVFVAKEENIGANNSSLYLLKNEQGETTKVWDSAGLNLKLKNIELGSKIKIVFEGMKTNQNTGREFKDFSVYQEE